MNQKPTLFLLPNLIGENPSHTPFLPQSVDQAVLSLDGLIAESASCGRRYLGRFKTQKPAQNIPLALFNKNTPDDHIDFLLEPIRKGETWGLICDSGLPCLADPGSKLVKRARQLGIPIHAFTGPCSITLALMLSGIYAQSFSFLGYLPKEEKPLKAKIHQIEGLSRQEGMTFVFIEAPYRNEKLLKALLEKCQDSTWLAVAWQLTMPDQGILSQTIAQWKKMILPKLDKKEAIFILSSRG